MNARIVIAEDDLELGETISELLQGEGYDCTCFPNPEDALSEIQSNETDLLLTDLKMPEMSGIELTAKTKEFNPDIRVLIVTAYSSMPMIIEAIRLGVDNYVIKPFNSNELLFQINRALEKRTLILQHKQYQENLAHMVEEATSRLLTRQRALRASQMESIFAIGNIIEARDVYTRGHTERVTMLAVAVAKARGESKDRILDLTIGSPLHDIGKIGVRDSILKKEGPLTFEEYDCMKEHPQIGYKMISALDMTPGVIACILSHHERFDGNGYPFGLAADDIPVEGRILSVCDAFDAMTSSRVYRPAMPLEKAISIIREENGKQFDPEMAAVFIDLVESTQFDLILDEAVTKSSFTNLISEMIDM